MFLFVCLHTGETNQCPASCAKTHFYRHGENNLSLKSRLEDVVVDDDALVRFHVVDSQISDEKYKNRSQKTLDENDTELVNDSS